MKLETFIEHITEITAGERPASKEDKAKAFQAMGLLSFYGDLEGDDNYFHYFQQAHAFGHTYGTSCLAFLYLTSNKNPQTKDTVINKENTIEGVKLLEECVSSESTDPNMDAVCQLIEARQGIYWKSDREEDVYAAYKKIYDDTIKPPPFKEIEKVKEIEEIENLKQKAARYADPRIYCGLAFWKGYDIYTNYKKGNDKSIYTNLLDVSDYLESVLKVVCPFNLLGENR